VTTELATIEGGSGFNPCSLGCCSERYEFRWSPRLYNEVSILVLLDVALKGDGGRHRGAVGSLVSILVLLDVALKEEEIEKR